MPSISSLNATENQLFDWERLIHSIKTAFACLIGFIITKTVHLQVDQWLIITILVVMCAQLNVGSVIQKSYMRFLGTLTGSCIAIFTIALLGNNWLASAIVIAISASIFSFIATSDKSYNDAGTLGAVTVVIILIGQNPTITTGIMRFFEISIGILIATFISQFIFPVHAKNHLRLNQAKTFIQLRNYYRAVLTNPKAMKNEQGLQDFGEDISRSLITQRKLVNEAKREQFGKKFNTAYFKQCLWCEKEILRSIGFMHTASQHCHLEQNEILDQFHEAICQALEKIARCLETKKIMSISLPTIDPLKTALLKNIHEKSTDESVYINGFLFCAEILVASLSTLITAVTNQYT